MIIILCGNTKFADEYKFWNLLLTLEGYIVLSCAVMGHSEGIQFERKQKALLDVVHLQKIDLSDAVFVIDKDKYIGESTEREIIYAEQNGKGIYLFSDNNLSGDKNRMLFANKNRYNCYGIFSIQCKNYVKVKEMLTGNKEG